MGDLPNGFTPNKRFEYTTYNRNNYFYISNDGRYLIQVSSDIRYLYGIDIHIFDLINNEYFGKFKISGNYVNLSKKQSKYFSSFSFMPKQIYFDRENINIFIELIRESNKVKANRIMSIYPGMRRPTHILSFKSNNEPTKYNKSRKKDLKKLEKINLSELSPYENVYRTRKGPTRFEFFEVNHELALVHSIIPYEDNYYRVKQNQALYLCGKNKETNDFIACQKSVQGLLNYLQVENQVYEEDAEYMLNSMFTTVEEAKSIIDALPEYESAVIERLYILSSFQKHSYIDKVIESFALNDYLPQFERKRNQLLIEEAQLLIEGDVDSCIIENMEVVAPQNDIEWRKWLDICSSNGVNAPYVVQKGEVSYFIIGEVYNASQQILNLEISASGTLYKKISSKISLFTISELEKIGKYNEKIVIPELLSKEKRSFVMMITTDETTLSSGADIMPFVTVFSNLVFQDISTDINYYEGTITSDEIDKQEYWLNSFKNGLDYEVKDISYFTERTYNSESYYKENERIRNSQIINDGIKASKTVNEKKNISDLTEKCFGNSKFVSKESESCSDSKVDVYKIDCKTISDKYYFYMSNPKNSFGCSGIMSSGKKGYYSYSYSIFGTDSYLGKDKNDALIKLCNCGK